MSVNDMLVDEASDFNSDIPMDIDIDDEDLAFRICVDLNNTTPNEPFMSRSDYIQKLRESRPLTLAEFNIAKHCNYFTNIRLNCIEHNFDDYSKEYFPEQYCFNDCNCFRQFFFSSENINYEFTLNENANMYWAQLTDRTPLIYSNSFFEFEQRLRENRPLTFEELIFTIQCDYFSKLRRRCIKNNFDYVTTHIHQPTNRCVNTCVCHSMPII
jgi:hypothetical protein